MPLPGTASSNFEYSKPKLLIDRSSMQTSARLAPYTRASERTVWERLSSTTSMESISLSACRLTTNCLDLQSKRHRHNLAMPFTLSV
jgi:hypothetical protein